MVFDELQNLPKRVSNGPVRFDPTLKSEIQSILPLSDFYNVITDPEHIEKTGAVIVSQMSEQVDFPMILYGRVSNLVPMDNIEDAISTFTAATQTVGIYPPKLRKKIRDIAALRGGQIFQPLGYVTAGSMVAPQDGVEVERRMCTWVVDNDCEPETVQAPWLELGKTV
jgi:Acyl-CoA reductase (LuxC)